MIPSFHSVHAVIMSQPQAAAGTAAAAEESSALTTTLRRIDPLLQFLTKATGETAVPLSTLRRALPAAFVSNEKELLSQVLLLHRLGILHVTTKNDNDDHDSSNDMNHAQPSSWQDASFVIGFPPPSWSPDTESNSSMDTIAAAEAAATESTTSSSKKKMSKTRKKEKKAPSASTSSNNVSLHGSTKTAAKRRLAALKKRLKEQEKQQQQAQRAASVKDSSSEATTTTSVATESTTSSVAKAAATISPSNNSTTTPTNNNHTPSPAEEKKNDDDPSKKLPAAAASTVREQEQSSPPPKEKAIEISSSPEATIIALQALQQLLGLDSSDYCDGDVDNKEDTQHQSDTTTTLQVQQASFAATMDAQSAVHATLPDDILEQIPSALWEAFGFTTSSCSNHEQRRREEASRSSAPLLYQHQVTAITAAMSGQHTAICTGTGSGKSLCFLLPALAAAAAAATSDSDKNVSLLLFPTKALAQDQLSKLTSLLERMDDDDDTQHSIHPVTLDGDTPHATRTAICSDGTANVILTNPDFLHATMLSQTAYRPLLSRLKYVVLDEAHVYQGVWGAHVTMILSRLMRCCVLCCQGNTAAAATIPTFIAASATLPWPDNHFCRLCPLLPCPKEDSDDDTDDNTNNDNTANKQQPYQVVADDTSPRAAKHFFVWNPPILGGANRGLNSLSRPGKHSRYKSSSNAAGTKKRPHAAIGTDEVHGNDDHAVASLEASAVSDLAPDHAVTNKNGKLIRRRRHAADETALLLARAVTMGVRCIAFAKTRNLVEWIYEGTLRALKPTHPHLIDKVESYRGGYSREERRKIEQRLFRNELLGVVGTNALELGVDIGGIDLTLHCGYPSSHASLLQQAGRAGRGGASSAASCAVVVCFNSPSEQHLWRHPTSLLAKGVVAPNTIPLEHGGHVVQGHLLCASAEFPLTGALTVNEVQSAQCNEQPAAHETTSMKMSDHDLFGGKKIYEQALESLIASGSMCKETILAPQGCADKTVTLYKAHPFHKKPWASVSIRSIEPVNYALVDLAHPQQGGRTDGIHHTNAILDTIPYSRVFYHAHPGAIITHRGHKYKVMSMTRPPPPNTASGYRSNQNLAAFARRTNARYSTRPLSTMKITVVKQIERIELHPPPAAAKATPPTAASAGAAAQASVSKEAQKSPSSPSVAADKETAPAALAFAGCGAVTVNRSVHGYKKLSLITRDELSRSELSLPDLEFDTFGFWIDTEADILGPLLGEKYGEGVHALSHAIMAVAPLFAPGLVQSDIECDHSVWAPTRVALFDERAGGSGSCERLWKNLFQPNNILQAAISLLEECSMCSSDADYESGCPACIHASQCLKFNNFLCRSSALMIGRRMLSRLQSTDLYKSNANAAEEKQQHAALNQEGASDSPTNDGTPRRKARNRALARAKEMGPARDRQFVVGRPSWPMDGGNNVIQNNTYIRGGRQEME